MPDPPTGTVTMVFTDIEGSTRLLQTLGPDVYTRSLAASRSVCRQAFVAGSGREVDVVGDAFFGYRELAAASLVGLAEIAAVEDDPGRASRLTAAGLEILAVRGLRPGALERASLGRTAATVDAAATAADVVAEELRRPDPSPTPQEPR